MNFGTLALSLNMLQVQKQSVFLCILWKERIKDSKIELKLVL